MRDSPRIRRLRSDFRAVTELAKQSSIFSFESKGDPPDRYIIRFRGKGLFRREQDRTVKILEEHVILIRLGAHYPRMIPDMKWKSQTFHPNVATNGAICLGGYTKHWVPSLGLDELCNMLWDMIRFANYDIASPYNREAANWAAVQQQHRFPLDRRPLRDLAKRAEENEAAEESAGQTPHSDEALPAGDSVIQEDAEASEEVPLAELDADDGIVFLGDEEEDAGSVSEDDDEVLYIE